jgi:transposase
VRRHHVEKLADARVESKADRSRRLIALCARLTVAGKAHNAARIACARKLLIYANTVVQRGTPWSERTLGA